MITLKHMNQKEQPEWLNDFVPEVDRYRLLTSLVTRAISISISAKLPRTTGYTLAFPNGGKVDLFVEKRSGVNYVEAYEVSSPHWRRCFNSKLGGSVDVIAYFINMGYSLYTGTHKRVISKSDAHMTVVLEGFRSLHTAFDWTWRLALNCVPLPYNQLVERSIVLSLDSPDFLSKFEIAYNTELALKERQRVGPPLVIDHITVEAPDLDRYPTSNCPCCLEKFQGIRVLLDCSHRLCVKCFTSTEKPKRCPLCRSEVLVNPRVVEV